MKRAALALFCAASLVAFSGLSGCSNSSGGGAPFVPQTTTTTPPGGGQPAASLPREAAGKKYDAMSGEWVFDRSICPWNDSESSRSFFCFDSYNNSAFIYAKSYPDENGNTPVSLSISNRKYTLVVQTSSGQDKSLSHGSFKSFQEFVDSYKAYNGYSISLEATQRSAKKAGVDLEPDDVFIETPLSAEKGAFLKKVSDKLYLLTDYCVCSSGSAPEIYCGCLVFRKKGSSPSGGGSGTVSFSLQGNWKMKGDTQSGRWIQIKSDGTFDFYKNGSLYNLYTDRTFAQSGSSVTVGYTASVLSVSDKFAVSGSASEMKWTLEKSSYVTGGQTYEDTTSSAALQALWDIMGSEVTLVPYE